MAPGAGITGGVPSSYVYLYVQVVVTFNVELFTVTS
jgi:hypothetical protein